MLGFAKTLYRAVTRPGDGAAFNDKLQYYFQGAVVPKGLGTIGNLQRLPRFVSEFLIARDVKTSAELDQLEQRVGPLVPDPARKEVLKHELLTRGSCVLLDRIEVMVDLRKGTHTARIPALDETAFIDESIPRRFQGLLLNGMWGNVKICRSGKGLAIQSFEPLQVDHSTVSRVAEARSHFTDREWLNLMLGSAGLNASKLTERQALLVLCRLVPLVERNVNMIELGPRGTGKTFMLRNVSPHVFLVSGGKASPATLFGNLASKAPGVFSTNKVVFLDEISHTSFSDATATVSMLKDYLESGRYSRGAQTYASDCGFVMAGNLDVQGGRPHGDYEHYFEMLPDELQDVALLDRVHAYIPGWEIPKITRQGLAGDLGLVSDYFGEYLCWLRQKTFTKQVARLKWLPGMTQRDMVAIERTTSGLLKLLHPDGVIPLGSLKKAASIGVELRQRVHDQLTVMAPGEFEEKELGFEGMEHD